jgi:hypothetical protein
METIIRKNLETPSKEGGESERGEGKTVGVRR